MENSKEKIHSVVSQIIFLIALLIIWEITAKAHLFGNSSELVFPPLEKIAEAFVNNFKYGYAGTSFWVYILNSMKLLLLGLVIGILLSILFSSFAIVCKTFHYIYNSIVSICDLLPGIALLPIIIIIFGIKPSVIVFLVIHAVIWPMSRNILDGFQSVPRIYVEAGMNIGLKGFSLLTGVIYTCGIFVYHFRS